MQPWHFGGHVRPTETEDMVYSDDDGVQITERPMLKMAQIEAVLDNMQEGLSIFDLNGNVRHINKRGASIWGFQSPDEYHKNIDEFQRDHLMYDLDGNQVPFEEWALPKVLRGEIVSEYMLEVRRSDKPGTFLSFNGMLVHGADGHPVLAILTYRDVTEALRIHKALEYLRTKAEEEAAKKEQFLQVAAHELRNPLQVLKGVVQILKVKTQSLPDDPLTKHLQVLDNQVLLMSKLICDLIEASRVTDSAFALETKRLDLAALLTTVVESCGKDLHDRQLFAEIATSPLLIEGDSTRLGQVIESLLSNAVKFTGQGGNIWVRATGSEGFALITVEDDGIGLEEDELERIFEGFHRSKPFSQWGMGGLGLGLYISRAVARLHGGELTASRRAHGGSVFSLRIPMATNENAPLRSGEAFERGLG